MTDLISPEAMTNIVQSAEKLSEAALRGDAIRFRTAQVVLERKL